MAKAWQLSRQDLEGKHWGGERERDDTLWSANKSDCMRVCEYVPSPSFVSPGLFFILSVNHKQSNCLITKGEGESGSMATKQHAAGGCGVGGKGAYARKTSEQ